MNFHVISVLLVVTVMCCGTNRTTDQPGTHRGIVLRTDGPRGGVYVDPGGGTLGYWIYRVQVLNDSTVPVELTLDFPSDPITMLPHRDKHPNVFLFPEELTPDTAQNIFNFGIKGSEAFLTTRPNQPTLLRKTIQPGEDHFLYIGVVLPPDGVGRAELFVAGQGPDSTSYFPPGSIQTKTRKGDVHDLIFGIAIDPPAHYVMLHCGRIFFKQ